MALAFQIEEEGRVQIVRIYLASNTSQFSHDRQRERERFFGLYGVRRLYSYFHLPETKPTFLPSFLEDLRINEHLLQHLAREEGP